MVKSHTPAGPAGKAAALNPARSYRSPGSTGRASFAAAPIFPRAAHQRLPGPASCGMEGEGHAVPIDRAQVLGPLEVRASAAAKLARPVEPGLR